MSEMLTYFIRPASGRLTSLACSLSSFLELSAGQVCLVKGHVQLSADFATSSLCLGEKLEKLFSPVVLEAFRNIH